MIFYILVLYTKYNIFPQVYKYKTYTHKVVVNLKHNYK